MPIMRSGLITAGRFAYKVRRVIFAQLAGDLREKRIENKAVAFHVAQLNKFLYFLLVDRLKVNKSDAVRLSIEYEVSEGKILWRFDTLRVEVFRRMPNEEINTVVTELVPEAEKIISAPVEYVVEYMGETSDGDHIYVLRVNGREEGVIEVIQIDEEFLYIKVGVFLTPEPAKVEKVKVALEGRGPEEVLNTVINELINKGKPLPAGEAESIINYVKSRLGEAR
ncbi:MAG: DUF2258 domain-containing protein [Zestosphaera sp.]